MNRIALAEREWQAQNRNRAMELLMQCDPQRRGWEWKFVSRLCFATPHVSLPAKEMFIGQAKFDPSGKYLAASDTTGLRIWDASNLALLFEIDQPVTKFDFDPRGHRLAAAIGSEVKVIDVHSGEVIETLFSGEEPLHNVVYDSVGERLAILDRKHTLTILDLDSRDTLPSFPLSQAIVQRFGTSMQFLPGTDRMIVVQDPGPDTGAHGHVPYVTWDVVDQEVVENRTIPGVKTIHSSSALDVSNDGNRIAIRGQHALLPTFRVYDFVQQKEYQFAPGIGGTRTITAAKFDPTGKTIAIAVNEMNVGVEDLPGAKNDLAGFIGAMTVLATKAHLVAWHDLFVRCRIGSANSRAAGTDWQRGIGAGVSSRRKTIGLCRRLFADDRHRRSDRDR